MSFTLAKVVSKRPLAGRSRGAELHLEALLADLGEIRGIRNDGIAILRTLPNPTPIHYSGIILDPMLHFPHKRFLKFKTGAHSKSLM